MLIKERDFLNFEYVIRTSVTIPQRVWLDKSFKLYKSGNLRYSKLYHSMERAVVGGHSSFKSMEELASHIERDAWYLHNYGDAKHWEKENKKVNKNGKNKSNNSLSGR